MADNPLESNLILKTRTEKPDMTGIQALSKGFSAIDAQLKALTAKPWVITVRMTVDDTAIKAAGISMKGGGSGVSGFSSGKFAVGPGGSILYGRQTTSINKEGEATTTYLNKIAGIQGRIEHTTTAITNAQGGLVKSVQEQLSLEQKVALAQERKLKMAAELRRYNDQQAKLAYEGRGLGAQFRLERNNPNITPLNFSSGEVFARIQASEREAARRRAENQRVTDAATLNENRVRNREQLASDKASERMAIRSDVQQYDQYGRAVLSDNRNRNSVERSKDKAAARQAQDTEDEFYNRRVAIAKADRQDRLRAARDAEAERLRQERAETNARGRMDRREARDYLSDIRRTSRYEGTQAGIAAAEGRGFTVRSTRTTGDVITGNLNRQTEAARVTGNAFTGLRVELLRFNDATGKVDHSILNHTQSIKYLGDSLASSASKVLNWTIATTAIFASIAVITDAAKAVAELEQNTVLLARVGRGLGDSFSDRIGPAKELTAQIVELTTVYGGYAEAATRAATVFARAGRSQQEILEGVRVSLIASKIAELDVEEAAKLISSAMLQFNLKAKDLLPTLDVLNTLSNNYRVSTDDLLQSISRAGSVYDDHGGRLSELASLTAVVSQETSRSGAEIGNAIKTIISQLDRLDVQKDLFDELGISTVNFSGDSKSLTKILYEESLALDKLSTSEQKQLTLKQAGIRQRGILIASLKNSPEAIIAENKSLITKSSAETEFKEGANTLVEKLSRLRAEFVKFVSIGSGPLQALAHTLLDLVSNLLKLLNLFGGAGAKLIGLAAAFLAIRSIITGVISASNALIGTNIALATSYTALNISMGNWLAIGATVAVALYSIVTANSEYSLSTAEASSAVESNIIAEENRRKAILDTTEAIYRLIEAKKKNGDEEARRLASSIDIRLPEGPVTEEGLLGASRKAQQESIDRQKELAKDSIFLKEQALEKTKADFKAFEYKGGQRQGFESEDQFIKRRRTERIKLTAEREKAERELQDARSTSEALKVIDQDFNPDKQQKRLRENIHESYLGFFNRDRTAVARGAGNSLSAEASILAQAKDYDVLSTSVAKLATELTEAASLNEKMNSESYIEAGKELNKQILEQAKAYEALNKARNARYEEQNLAAFASENRLRDFVGKSDTKRTRGLSYSTSPYGDSIAEIDALRQSQLDRLGRNARVLIAGGNSAGTVQATRKDSEEALLKLKDLELSKAEAILEAETAIALERKKSADEALRAVGALSDEDKLRFRAQAAYFAANPGKKISIEEQLNSSSRDIGITNSFFRSKLDQLGSGAAGPYGAFLAASGFGSTPELDRGAEEVARARHGRTDKELLGGALNNANRFDEKVQQLKGNEASNITDFLRNSVGFFSGLFDGGGNSKGERVQVDVSGDTLQLEPLINAFRDSVVFLMDTKVKEMTANVQRIIDQGKNIPVNQPKKNFGNF